MELKNVAPAVFSITNNGFLLIYMCDHDAFSPGAGLQFNACGDDLISLSCMRVMKRSTMKANTFLATLVVEIEVKSFSDS